MMKKVLQFFVVDAFGGHLFFRTNSRDKDQEIANLVYYGRYMVRVEMKAVVR